MRRNKRLLYRAALFLVFLCFAGCGSGASGESMKQTASTTQSDYESAEIYEEAPMEEEIDDAGTDTGAEGGQVADNRKLVKTVSMSVETEEFDALVQKVEARVKALGGYIETMNLHNGSYYYDTLKNAEMTLRIPADRLDDFITAVEKISNVRDRQESTEDITLQYVDVKSRKEALLVEQERLMAFLEQAESMEEIIAIEERLSQVRYELELMESRLRTFDNQVDYATVHLSIEEVTILTPVEEVGAWEKMSTGFMNSVRNIGTGLKNFFIGLVIAMPYLLLWAAVILLVLLIVRAVMKKRRKKERPDKKVIYGPYGNGGSGYAFGRSVYGQNGQQAAKPQSEAFPPLAGTPSGDTEMKTDAPAPPESGKEPEQEKEPEQRKEKKEEKNIE